MVSDLVSKVLRGFCARWGWTMDVRPVPAVAERGPVFEPLEPRLLLTAAPLVEVFADAHNLLLEHPGGEQQVNDEVIWTGFAPLLHDTASGGVDVLNIRVDFDNVPGDPVSDAVAEQTFLDAGEFMRQSSWGEFWFENVDVTPTYRMPENSTFYTTQVDGDGDAIGHNTLMSNAIAAAAADGFDTGDYWSFSITFANIGFPWGGLGFINAAGIWLDGTGDSVRVTAHEFGHNLRARHASTWNVNDGDPLSPNGSYSEYGDVFDVMGSGAMFEGHFNTYWKTQFGWMDGDDNVLAPNTDGVYRIYAHDMGDGAFVDDRIYAIRLPTGEDPDYWLEFRQQFDADPLDSGLEVRLSPQWREYVGSDPDLRNVDTLLLDTTGSATSAFDYRLDIGEVYVDPNLFGAIMPLDAGVAGDGNWWLDVHIGEIPLELTELTLSATEIDEGQMVTINGSFINDSIDPHQIVIDWGDGISSDTVLNLNSRVWEFQAFNVYPDDIPSGIDFADYEIVVTVTDSSDATDSVSEIIRVNNVDPTITGLVLSATTINEGDTVTLSGMFADPGILDEHTVIIEWGDSGLSADTVLNLAVGERTFEASNLYLDDLPTGEADAVYTITVTVLDDDTGVGVDTTTITVLNVDPEITSFASDATFEDKGQEGEPVHIFANFTDPGILDTFTAEVDWGDGSAPTLATVNRDAGETDGTVEASHIYTDGGIYTITLTLTDDDTGYDVALTTAVITGVGVNDGTLFIVGSHEDNHVHVHQVGRNNIRVHADFIPEPYRTFDLADVDQIIAYLCLGDDHMTLAGNVAAPAIIHTDGGDNFVKTGSGPAVVVGGPGDNVLNAGTGRNILIAGSGNSRLVAGPSDDVLIGGTTDADDDDAMLMDMLETWNSGDPYDDRVAALDALFTFIDDGNEDKLTGAGGRNLYYAGTDDVITGAKPNETIQMLNMLNLSLAGEGAFDALTAATPPRAVPTPPAATPVAGQAIQLGAAGAPFGFAPSSLTGPSVLDADDEDDDVLELMAVSVV